MNGGALKARCRFLGRSAALAYVPWLAVLAAIGLLVVSVAPVSGQAQAPAQLTSADVLAVLRAGAEAVGDSALSVAVVDRAGRILGVYARPGAASTGPDTAVTVARTAALFSNDQAPLSSRTIRFISGIHFPPGVANTPNAALYGIENTNRGCQLNAADTAPWDRPRSIAGAGVLPGRPLARCTAADPSGCAQGESIRVGAQDAIHLGFTTGKRDVQDPGGFLGVPVNPGGFALYRNGAVIGGVGVSGVTPARAEYAAFVAAAATSATSGVSPLPMNPLPPPGAVFIEGLRLPFFGSCISVECVLSEINRGPPGGASGTFSAADVLVPPRPGQPVPDGYLIGPRASGVSGGLSTAEVQRMIAQAIARANVTRAQIRLPLTQPTRMIIAVSDQAGDVLAAFRMPDATVFSFDVAITKARNAYYFSTRPGYTDLRALAESGQYRWEPEPPGNGGWAVTNRTLSFGGQPLFPPGIDLSRPPTPGPWFELFRYDTLNPCTEGPGPSRGGDRRYVNQSGIVWFPGSAPIYRNGILVGGVGVSGDGVEQDDYVTAAAVEGFEPPVELRVDRSVMRSRDGAVVRLPYWKFPRNPELR